MNLLYDGLYLQIKMGRVFKKHQWDIFHLFHNKLLQNLILFVKIHENEDYEYFLILKRAVTINS